MATTKTTTSLREKLFNAKSEIGKISKDSTNPFFKSKYFDVNSLLEHVEPILNKHRLLLLQPIIAGSVKTEILDIDSDDIVECEIALPAITDPQKLGSCITYYRRYSLQSLLGLQAEDDDGNRAAKPATPKKEILDENHPKWQQAKAALKAGTITLEAIKNKYDVRGQI